MNRGKIVIYCYLLEITLLSQQSWGWFSAFWATNDVLA
jgi:hypothetical protein